MHTAYIESYKLHNQSLKTGKTFSKIHPIYKIKQ